jgi:hypothetical protein
MEGVAAMLAGEEQPLVGPIGLAGMPTSRTGLTAIVGIDLDDHTVSSCRFVGKHGVQFGEAPCGLLDIGTPLLFAGLLACAPLRPFADMGQVFQADKAVGIGFHNAFTHDMISVLL